MSTDLIIADEIRSKIFSIRGMQVMLDRDFANFYEIETRALKQAVKRHLIRFPKDFMIVLDKEEIEYMVSQSVIPSKQFLGGAKPYAFTEQGVAMLSSILTSSKAVEISLQIIRAFIAMRKFLTENASIFQRLDSMELKQLESDKKFEIIFDAIESKKLIPSQGIFFDGQIFDAYKFASDLVRTAKKSIVLIDNFIDDNTISILSKKETCLKVTILTKTITKQLKTDVKKANEQYGNFEIKIFKNSHDRFLIIDDTEVFHLGASLKDLGKKWFAFSKMNKSPVESIINSLAEI